MPVPMWVAEINKRVFNKWELRKGVRPVVIHKGRSSGRSYETPLDAHEVDGGYVFILMYGARSDWVKNVLASGHARLRVGGTETELDHPRLLTKDEAVTQLSAHTKLPPDFLNVTEYLRMDRAA